ncbi:MAG: DUF4199 domain-containing protein [Daejeonella sp.]
MEPSLLNLNKAAVNNGLIIGIISAVIGIVTYYMFPSLMGSIWFGIGMLIVSLLIYIFFTIDLRKKIGGYWSFRQALKGIFLMAFVAGILYSVVNYVFYKFAEPDAFERVSEFVEAGVTKSLESMGMDQDQIDEAVSKQLESLKAQLDPSPTDLLKNLGISILIEFIMSLIFAAIFKKEAPVFASVEDDD